MTEILFWTITGIIAVTFLVEKWLDYLNLKHTYPKLPDPLKDIFNPEEYRKSQLYKQDNTRFSFISGTFSTVVLLVAIFTGLFGWLDALLQRHIDSYYLLLLLFFGILAFVSDLLSIPFQLYDTFVIEERYGFNRTTKRTFLKDKLKGWLIGVIIGGAVLLAITWFYHTTGQFFWLIAWGFITVFSIFMNMFYSRLIVPLFNKQVPLEKGSLRDKIEAYARKTGYRLTDIYVIDGSRRSSKANAYFSGLGSQKRVVLYDTLINDLDEEEIVAVLAHEIGHFRKRHTLKSLLLGVAQTGVMLYLFSLLVKLPEVSMALGGQEASFHLGLIAFAILYSPVSFLLGIVMNMLSRKYEFEADRFATITFGKERLITSLKKLSKKNLSNLTPHPLYVYFNYSHPTLLQRIESMNQIDEPNQ
jgi:STE24 endopeptidase